MAHVYYFSCVYIVSYHIYVLLSWTCDLQFFFLTLKMLVNIIKHREFVYTKEQRYTKVIYYYYLSKCMSSNNTD